MWGIEKKLLKSQCCVIHALHHGKMMEKLNYQHFFLRRKKILFPGQMQKGNSTFFIHRENILQTIHIDAVEI